MYSSDHMSDGPRTLTQYSPPVLLHPRVWTFLLSPIEGPVQEVTETDASLGEALGDGREMRVNISLVHGDHLLRLVGVQGLVILLSISERHVGRSTMVRASHRGV